MNPKEPSQQAAGTNHLIGAEKMGKFQRNYADIVPKYYGSFSKPNPERGKKILVLEGEDGFELSIQTVIHSVDKYYYYEVADKPMRVVHRIHKNACWPVEKLEEIQADWDNFCEQITARRKRAANFNGPGIFARMGTNRTNGPKDTKTDEQIGLEFLKDLRRQQRENVK